MAARLPDIGTFPGRQMLGVTLPPPPPPPLPPLPPPPPPPPPPSSVAIQSSLHTPTIYRPHFSTISHRDPTAQNSKNHMPSRDTGNSNRQQTPNCGFKRPLQTDNSNNVKKIKSETLVDSPDMNLSSSVSENSCDPNNTEKSSLNKSAPGESTQRIKDSSHLPKELTKLFGALKCDLCSVTVNSTVQAKMHYIGKQHEKKVNAFLIKWCKETGQPMPNVNVVPSKTKKPANLDELFCKVCNIALTSIQHAQQHYMGRNHLRVLNGHTPLKPGYFNKDTGKWQRLPQFEKVDPTGRFGIGVAFLPETPANSASPEPEATTSSNLCDVKSPSQNRRFFCELCQVATTSQDQLDMHLKGAKHRKAERIAATSGNSSQPVQSNIPLPSTPSDSILASVMKTNKADKNKSGIKDYSIYRTPSGQFYCQPCNLTLNSESQFSQHCESRKHKLAMLKKPANKGIGRGSLNLK